MSSTRQIIEVIKKYLKWGWTFVGIFIILYVARVFLLDSIKNQYTVPSNIVKAIFTTADAVWYYINLPIGYLVHFVRMLLFALFGNPGSQLLLNLIALPLYFAMGIFYGWLFNLRKVKIEKSNASLTVAVTADYKENRKTMFIYQIPAALLIGIGVDVYMNSMGVFGYDIPVMGFFLVLPVFILMLLTSIIYFKLKSKFLIILLSSLSGIAAMILVFYIYGLIIGASREYGLIYLVGFIPALVVGLGYGIYLSWYLKDKELYEKPESIPSENL